MKIDKIRLHKAIRKVENGTSKEAGRMKNRFLIILHILLQWLISDKRMKF